jgi:hypothetical protein
MLMNDSNGTSTATNAAVLHPVHFVDVPDLIIEVRG